MCAHGWVWFGAKTCIAAPSNDPLLSQRSKNSVGCSLLNVQAPCNKFVAAVKALLKGTDKSGNHALGVREVIAD